MKLSSAFAKYTRAAVGTLVCAIVASCVSVDIPVANLGVHAVKNPSVIERGRYLVYGPAHCGACHGDPARDEQRGQGREIPLSGGRRLSASWLGSFVAPNLTSDPIAGIGLLSDDTLVQILRYGVSRHGTRRLAPFMSFAGLADDDLQAILSFLRTLPPVANPVPQNDMSRLGAFALKEVIKVEVPSAPPAWHFAPTHSAEYGRYLAYAVANCHGCHTLRSKVTGSFVGPAFAGGMRIRESTGIFTSPNLTPIGTGIMRNRTEAEFIELFRARGIAQCHSPMPWGELARMTDVDLGAIFLYLGSLLPANTPQS
jgi:mono/diheme cytochrome c family protein